VVLKPAARAVGQVSNWPGDLISANKRTRAPFLDLGNCSLSEIPQEVAQLGWLTDLSLGIGWKSENAEFRDTVNTGKSIQITDLTRYRSLPGLRFLGLHGIAVSNLEPLSVMHNLRALDISKSSVSDISALSGLAHLEELRAWKAALSDLTPLRDLDGLRLLSISETNVSDLRPLTGHRALLTLYAHTTPITDITPLGTISTLQHVTVAGSGLLTCHPCGDISARVSLPDLNGGRQMGRYLRC
jgi:Leucine-rich repeat (LRR) protein